MFTRGANLLSTAFENTCCDWPKVICSNRYMMERAGITEALSTPLKWIVHEYLRDLGAGLSKQKSYGLVLPIDFFVQTCCISQTNLSWDEVRICWWQTGWVILPAYHGPSIQGFPHCTCFFVEPQFGNIPYQYHPISIKCWFLLMLSYIWNIPNDVPSSFPKRPSYSSWSFFLARLAAPTSAMHTMQKTRASKKHVHYLWSFASMGHGWFEKTFGVNMSRNCHFLSLTLNWLWIMRNKKTNQNLY